jgi:hypothetical protein
MRADAYFSTYIFGLASGFHLFHRCNHLRFAVLALDIFRFSSNLRFRSQTCAENLDHVIGITFRRVYSDNGVCYHH